MYCVYTPLFSVLLPCISTFFASPALSKTNCQQILEKLKDYTYINFDDSRFVQALHNDPEKFMRLHNNRVIFDEAQKVPELFDAIKIAVNRDRNNAGKFIVTDSSQFSLIKKDF